MSNWKRSAPLPITYIDIHFTNGKSKRISCESDVQLHTIVNKIVTNSRYKITFVSDLFSQSD